MLGRILRAALYRPWEAEDEGDGPEGYEIANDGTPEHYEFRVNENEDQVAVWIPAQGQWLIFKNVVVLQSFRAYDPGTLSNWRRFLEVEEVD